MRIKIIVTMAIILFTTIVCSADNNKSKQIQLGFYLGMALSPEVKDAHGDHIIDLLGQKADIKIGDIEIDQGIGFGVNTRYYFNKNLGVEVDAMFSTAKFPEQQVVLLGYDVTQPSSDMKFFVLSLGPVIRYKGDGIWKALNPFGSIALSILFGSASDVNMSPEYGKGGSSSIDGTGFTFGFGTQYSVKSFVISLEYRYESLGLNIDRFRSFEDGISINKNGSYLRLGGCLYL